MNSLRMFWLVTAFVGSIPMSVAADRSVYATLGETVLTQDMVDAIFSRIPEKDRLAFIRDAAKAERMLRTSLLKIYFADQARKDNFDTEPLIGNRAKLAADTELSELWLDELVARTPDADYEQLAREYFALNHEKFQTDASYSVTHLLVGTEVRAEEEARSLAQMLLEEAQASPHEFDRLVLEHSDDRSVEKNQGRFENVRKGKMVKPFEQAALELESPGQLSSLVKTPFGYHIIRLDGRTEPRPQTFEEVKSRLIEVQRTMYKEEVRSRIISDALANQIVVPEGAVEKMLQRYFGEIIERAPLDEQ
jgi:hypothetical protein